jgi:hypothetical protein
MGVSLGNLIADWDYRYGCYQDTSQLIPSQINNSTGNAWNVKAWRPQSTSTGTGFWPDAAIQTPMTTASPSTTYPGLGIPKSTSQGVDFGASAGGSLGDSNTGFSWLGNLLLGTEFTMYMLAHFGNGPILTMGSSISYDDSILAPNSLSIWNDTGPDYPEFIVQNAKDIGVIHNDLAMESSATLGSTNCKVLIYQQRIDSTLGVVGTLYDDTNLSRSDTQPLGGAQPGGTNLAIDYCLGFNTVDGSSVQVAINGFIVKKIQFYDKSHSITAIANVLTKLSI